MLIIGHSSKAVWVVVPTRPTHLAAPRPCAVPEVEQHQQVPRAAAAVAAEVVELALSGTRHKATPAPSHTSALIVHTSHYRTHTASHQVTAHVTNSRLPHVHERVYVKLASQQVPL